MSEEALVLSQRKGRVLEVVLNRPKALNSLTLPMVRLLDEALDLAERDSTISAVLLRGAGERGLCAGGDIRAIYESGREGTPLATEFWREEYRVNARINRFAKPYVVIMDGFVMGGGIGVASFGSHRIVTERSRIAMPETAIGYFPDVGASWLLSRPGSELGTFLGLTGNTIGAGDAIVAGLADCEIPSDRIALFLERLYGAATLDAAEVDRIVSMHLTKNPSSPEIDRGAVDRAFVHDTVEAIVQALEHTNTDFSRQTLATLLSRSPTSLKVTLRLLRNGRTKASLEECLDMEFVGTHQILKEPDFYEGIRAAVIDKDRNPKWAPAVLGEVLDSHVDLFFRPSLISIFKRRSGS